MIEENVFLETSLWNSDLKKKWFIGLSSTNHNILS